jgi:hypothetical protein
VRVQIPPSAPYFNFSIKLSKLYLLKFLIFRFVPEFVPAEVL